MIPHKISSNKFKQLIGLGLCSTLYLDDVNGCPSGGSSVKTVDKLLTHCATGIAGYLPEQMYRYVVRYQNFLLLVVSWILFNLLLAIKGQ